MTTLMTRPATVQYLVRLARMRHGDRAAELVLLMATEPLALGHGDIDLGYTIIADLERTIDDRDAQAERVLAEMEDAISAVGEREAAQWIVW